MIRSIWCRSCACHVDMEVPAQLRPTLIEFIVDRLLDAVVLDLKLPQGRYYGIMPESEVIASNGLMGTSPEFVILDGLMGEYDPWNSRRDIQGREVQILIEDQHRFFEGIANKIQSTPSGPFHYSQMNPVSRNARRGKRRRK